MTDRIVATLSQELTASPVQVSAAIALLDEGATVPFIARYRKEVTGGLDDTQLRLLEQRLAYLRELEERRTTVLNSIREQGKLTEELAQAIAAADTRTRLEDLYLPYKPKRKTRGQAAIEAGLLPLADRLLENPSLDPQVEADAFLAPDHGITDAAKALEGARYILMERFAEDAELLGRLRDYLWEHGRLTSTVVAEKQAEAAKFQDYFDHREPLANVPSHRALAMLRGRREGMLNLAITCGDEATDIHPCEHMVANHWNIRAGGRPADDWLATVVRWTWRVKLYSHLETSLLNRLREAAETEAIQVFSHNLRDLLLAPPVGNLATIGLDPGLRTGVKVAVVDETGKLVDFDTIYPNPPQNRQQEAAARLRQLAQKHRVKLVAIGNGTASRETDRFVGDLIKAHPELGLRKVMVSEAGASVYSASEAAAREFPDLDVTIRGAVSIARRLQDPLSELVKIEPKSIGVGQYQHDVSQAQLARQLDTVVEDCVNRVGVDVNTASVPLLARVSGLNRLAAENLVEYRDRNGRFDNREQLKCVSGMGARTFEQAAGFLRIRDGSNPLDASGVHPEAYAVAERIAADNKRSLVDAIGDRTLLSRLDPRRYTDARFGEPTVRDIIAELEKPGRDPRGEFRTAAFSEGVEKLSDLEQGMVLEGCVTNVTNFGAFVDIGVHQDGLVHISALSHSFVKDPRTVVKAGDIVKVKVMSVDAPRKRIALSMRLDDQPGTDTQEHRGNAGGSAKEGRHRATAGGKRREGVAAAPTQPLGSLAQALLKATKKH